MKRGFIFGVGAFICSAVYWEVLYVVRNGHLGFILSRLSTFFLMFVLGWIFYNLGAKLFRRHTTVLFAFALGVIAMLVQEAFTAAFISRTSLDLSHSGLLNTSWSGLLGAGAQLFLPFAVCAFFTPLLGRQKG